MKPQMNFPPPKKAPIIIYGVFLLCIYCTYLGVEYYGIRIWNFNSQDQERGSQGGRSSGVYYHK